MKNTSNVTPIKSAFLDGMADLIGQRVHEREIEHNGVFKTFYFREITAGESEDFQFSLMNPKTNEVDMMKVKGSTARLIAKCLCDEDGKPVAKPQEIDQLPTALREKLRVAVQEVNGNEKNEDSEDDGDSPSS